MSVAGCAVLVAGGCADGGIVGAHIDFFAALRVYYEALDALLGLGDVHVYKGGAWCR